MSFQSRINNLKAAWPIFLERLTDLREAIAFLWTRMGALRLPQVAGSLSYTSALSMVPLLVIVLSILTVLPQFQSFQKEIQSFMTENLMPAKMSKLVMQQINSFTDRSSSLSLIGGVFLVFSSLTTMATIDRVFDDIWQIKKRHSFRRNVLIYWAVLTLGPFVFGGTLLLINWLVHSVGGLPLIGGVLGVLLPFALAMVSFAALYVFVPSRRVQWVDAYAGGFVAAIIFVLLSQTFSAVFKSFSNYAILYGAFSILPALFLWLYVFWWGILFGAGLAANLPILKYERWRREPRVGDTLIEALNVLHIVYSAHQSPERMSTWAQIQDEMKLNSDELNAIMERLRAARWVGKVERADDRYGWALIADPNQLTLGDVYDVCVFDAPHYAEQAELQRAPWARYLIDLQHTPAHEVTLTQLFAATVQDESAA